MNNDTKVNVVQKLAEIKQMLTTMSQDDWLMPIGCSEEFTCVNHSWKYKSYKDSSKSSRYAHFIIMLPDRNIEIGLHYDKIHLEHTVPDDGSIITVDEIHHYINSIYKERHSFEINDSEIKKARNEISTLCKERDRVTKNIKNLEVSIDAMLNRKKTK